jgi:hypothetical protein
MMPRTLFGETAVQLGYLTAEQLAHALELQRQDDAEQKPRRPLGIVCVQQRYLTFDQVMQTLARQEAGAGAAPEAQSA